MYLRIKLSISNINKLLMALLIISIWAFNEVKLLTYSVKIVYIVLCGLYVCNRKKYNSKYQLWCLLMILLSFLSVAAAKNTSLASYTLINMIQVFLIAFITYGYIDSSEKIEFVMNCIIWAGLILTFRLLLVTPADVWLSWVRLGEAIGSNANDIGNKAAFSAIISLCFAKKNDHNRRIVYFLSFAVLTAIVLFSGSRKALLAVLLAFILLNTIGLNDKRKILLSFFVISVVLFFGYRLIMENTTLYLTIGRRIEAMIEVLFHGGSEAHSIDLRERYLYVAWQIIKQNPILGVGLNNFSNTSGIGVYSHCDYTEVACSYGIPGAIIYYYPLLSITIQYIFKKNKQDLDYAFLILQIVLLFIYVTMVMYTSVYVQIIIILFIACYHLDNQAKILNKDFKGVKQSVNREGNII